MLKRSLFGLVILSVFVTATPMAAQAADAGGEEIDRQTAAAYQSIWRKYGQYASKTHYGYVMLPNYQRRFQNSQGLAPTTAMNRLVKRWEEKKGNLVTKKLKYPPRVEGETLSRALMSMEMGQYGWVHSAEILKIIDDKRMVIHEVWSVDADKLEEQFERDEQQMARREGRVDGSQMEFNFQVRMYLLELQKDRDSGFEDPSILVGYDTRGLRVGQRWKGPNDSGFQVGVASWYTPEAEEEGSSRRRSRRSNPSFRVLTEVENTMRERLGEQEFVDFLHARGQSVKTFVELVREIRERDRRNADERIFQALQPPNPEQDD